MYRGRQRKREGLEPRGTPVEQVLPALIADKWTLLLIEILTERGDCRFEELSRACAGISQKMSTQTLRVMERDGLVTRTVYPVVPPKVVYALTDLGLGLGLSQAFCGVWEWAEANRDAITRARDSYAARQEEHRAWPDGRFGDDRFMAFDFLANLRPGVPLDSQGS